jgi:hypothetical protein
LEAPDVKAWVFVAALFVVAGPAFAVPPVAPPASAATLVREFMRATESNDLPAYANLFAADAKIETGAGASLDKAQWLKTVSGDFTPYRRTRFLSIFAGDVPSAGKASARVVLVVEVKRCPSHVIECFPKYRSDIITVEDRQIVRLETSGDLSHRLTAEGAWTFD